MIKENQHIEFKSAFGESVIETLAAFANSKGGKVYIGVDDNGNPIKNFSVGKETFQQWLNEIKNKTQPSIIPEIEEIKFKGKEVVCVSIHEFPIKPIAYRGRYYKRIKNANHQLTAIEIADLSMQSLQTSWDAYRKHGMSLSDIDPIKAQKFIGSVNAKGRFLLEGTWQQSLEKLRMINGENITNAAWLLFAKEPPGYNVHLGRFKTPSTIIDDRMFNGTLFETVEETMRYILSQIKVAFEISGKTTQRNEIFEYPLPALRELVLNHLFIEII